MIFIVFFFLLWISILLNQVLVILPLNVLHLFHLPPVWGLAILLGIFAWVFGD